jgi:LAO/AO transport system kinase
MGAQDLAARTLSGDRRACARLISLIEDRDPAGLAQLRQLPPATAFRVGITGPPGAGKSTLVDLLIQAARAAGDRVGVLAIDPSSPFTGGAILGDRVRMQAHATDPAVFIRSMGSRGHLGGLAAATASACRVLEAFGCGVILIETVGAGQSEVEIASLADAVLLVLAPNAGDGIQALKAGIMEIPDLFVVNKGDVTGAAATARDVRAMLEEAANPAPAGAESLSPVERIFVTRGLEALAESGVPDLYETLRTFDPRSPGEIAESPTWKAGQASPTDALRRTAPRRNERDAVLSEALEIVRERLVALGAPDITPGEDLQGAALRWLARLDAAPALAPKGN